MHQLSVGEFPRTPAVLRAGVEEGVAPGFVAGLWDSREPDRFRVTALGQRRVTPSPQPMLLETVFDLASVSKVKPNGRALQKARTGSRARIYRPAVELLHRASSLVA